jgi:hypothetical protein
LKNYVKISFLFFILCNTFLGSAQEIFTYAQKNDEFDIKVGEKKVIFLNIIGTDKNKINLEIIPELPTGFKLITPPSKFKSLNVGELKKVFFTIAVESFTPANEYEINLTIKSNDQTIKETPLKITVNKFQNILITPINKPEKLSQKTSETISYLVVNSGNTTEEIELSSRSGTIIGKSKIKLLPGESNVVKTVNILPQQNQEIRLLSFDLKCKIKDVENLFASVFTVPYITFSTQKSDSYQRFPITASVNYNRFTSNTLNFGAFLFDFTGSGFIDSKNKHKVEFIARGPNRFSLPRFGNIDQYLLSYNFSGWTIDLGDKMFTVSEITDNARFARGIDLKKKIGKNEVSVFYLKPRFFRNIHQEFGAKVNHSIKENINTGILFLHKNHTEKFQPLKTNFISLTSDLEFKHFKANAEASLSSTNKIFSPGFFYNSNLEYDKLRMYSNLIFTGKTYFGFFNNSFQFNNSVFYNLNKKVTVGYSKNISQLNPSLDEFYYTVSPHFSSNNFSIGYDLNKINKFRVNYIAGTREDKMEIQTFHFKERLLRYFYDLKLSNWSFRFDGDIGQSLNLLEVADNQKFNDLYRYRGLVRWTKKKHLNASVFFEHLNTTRYNTTLNNQKLFWFYGANTQFAIKNNLSVNLNYRNNFTPDELYQSQSFLDASVNYRIKNQEISLNASYAYIPPPINDRNLFATLKYTIHLNTPIRKKKGLGSLEGNILGRKTEGVVLFLNGKQVVTNKDGWFRFNDLLPGKYYLGVQKSTLGIGNAIDNEMPYIVEILPEQTNRLALNVIKTGNIKGAVFLKNLTFTDNNENILVELYNDKISKVTTTNNLGEFQFYELKEGSYKLRVLSDNIKKNYLMLNENLEVNVKEGEDVLFSFNFEQKIKKINFQKEKIILTDI